MASLIFTILAILSCLFCDKYYPELLYVCTFELLSALIYG